MKTTTRSASGTESGFNSTALTTEKIAVVAPMPSVSAATAASVNAGLCRNMRSECVRSLRKASMTGLDVDHWWIVGDQLLQNRQVGQRQPGVHHKRIAMPALREIGRLYGLYQCPDGAPETGAEAARGESAEFPR